MAAYTLDFTQPDGTALSDQGWEHFASYGMSSPATSPVLDGGFLTNRSDQSWSVRDTGSADGSLTVRFHPTNLTGTTGFRMFGRFAAIGGYIGAEVNANGVRYGVFGSASNPYSMSAQWDFSRSAFTYPEPYADPQPGMWIEVTLSLEGDMLSVHLLTSAGQARTVEGFSVAGSGFTGTRWGIADVSESGGIGGSGPANATRWVSALSMDTEPGLPGAARVNLEGTGTPLLDNEPGDLRVDPPDAVLDGTSTPIVEAAGGFLVYADADGNSALSGAVSVALRAAGGALVTRAEERLTGRPTGTPIRLGGEGGILTVTPPVAPVPEGLPLNPLESHWLWYTTSGTDLDGNTIEDWEPGSMESDLWGTFSIVVGGVDISWYNGQPTELRQDITETDPMGYQALSLNVSGLLKGMRAPKWSEPGSPVVVRRRLPDGSAGETLWEGNVLARRGRVPARVAGRPGGRVSTILDCVGTLELADRQIDTPERTPARRELGAAIREELTTEILNRQYTVTGVDTPGLYTIARGTWNSKIKGRVQDLLNESKRANGDQLTVLTHPGRRVSVEWRDTTTVAADIFLDQLGVDVDLEESVDHRFNRFFVEYVTPEGARFQGWRYPFFNGAFEPPPYPWVDENRVITVGTRDADTDTLEGVSVFKRHLQEMRAVGFDYNLIRTWTQQDANALVGYQRQWGLTLATGVVTPQTWTAAWAVSFDVGSLKGMRIFPMMEDPRLDERAYHPNGMDAGANPLHDPSVIPIVRFLNLGTNVTHEMAREAVQHAYNQAQQRIISGTITSRGVDLTLISKAARVSRFAIRAGMNLRVLDWEGGPIVLHVTARSISPDGTVAWTVDTAGRDAPDVIAQHDRDRAAFIGPVLRSDAQLAVSSTVPFDAESGAGKARIATSAGQWTVFPMPLSEAGQVVDTRIVADKPTLMAARFFRKRLTSVDMQKMLPTPLESGAREAAQEREITVFGRLIGWGDDAKAAGVGFGCDDAGTPGSDIPPNGMLLDGTAWSYYDLDQTLLAWGAVWTEHAATVTIDLRVSQA